MESHAIDRFLHVKSGRIYEAYYLLTAEEKGVALQNKTSEELDLEFTFIQTIEKPEIEYIVSNNKEYFGVSLEEN